MIIVGTASAPAGAKGKRVTIDEDRSVSLYRDEPTGIELQFKNGSKVRRLVCTEESGFATASLLADAFGYRLVKHD